MTSTYHTDMDNLNTQTYIVMLLYTESDRFIKTKIRELIWDWSKMWTRTMRSGENLGWEREPPTRTINQGTHSQRLSWVVIVMLLSCSYAALEHYFSEVITIQSILLIWLFMHVSVQTLSEYSPWTSKTTHNTLHSQLIIGLLQCNRLTCDCLLDGKNIRTSFIKEFLLDYK